MGGSYSSQEIAAAFVMVWDRCSPFCHTQPAMVLKPAHVKQIVSVTSSRKLGCICESTLRKDEGAKG